MSIRPITRHSSALFCAALVCAALLTATQGTAQTPETAAEQPPDLRSAPVVAPADTSVETVTAAENDRYDSAASPDASAANPNAITQIPLGSVPSDPVQPGPAAPEAADTSEPPNRWLEVDPSGDPIAVPASDAALDPLAQARRHWRGAVATGETDLGFRAWIMAALGEDTTAPREDDDIAPQTPLAGTSVDSQASRTRDVSGRWLARAGPVALGVAGRVVTTFGAAIPTAFCAPLIVCYIELEPGELLTDTPSWGDTVRWQVTIKFQGRDPETVVLEIKPSEDAGLTNLVIPTDRRLYTINLVNDPEVHTPILSFIYPDTTERVASERIAARKAQEAEAAASATAARAASAAPRRARLANTGVQTSAGLRAPGTLDFRFSVTGTARFRPVRVYTDGRKTYIDLHPNYRGPLPTVVPGAGEENQALNTRVTEGGKRLVVDRVIRDIWLQAGSRRVRIRRSAP